MVELERMSERDEVLNHRFVELEGIRSENGNIRENFEQGECSSSSTTPYFLDTFTLHETLNDFYIIGSDTEKKYWRVLKIGRSDPSNLVVAEDPTTYSYEESKSFVSNIVGLKPVTEYYGIVGFIKLSRSYYILLITERKEIGKICGHAIYSVSNYRMIPFCHSTALTYKDNSTEENRYKKLLQLVDIKENFYFSCSYPLMHRVQHNLSRKQQIGQSSLSHEGYDRTMFVWNGYLSHQIREHLKSTLWTVALIHGFFKQVMLSTNGKNFALTLIARRSCQFAGTRYEKRGVNEKGQAANDVEIEQIVWQVIKGECPSQITSVVQNRASIPLRWSQKPSLLTLKPEIIISECNDNYEATKLHFKNLRLRYEMPIIVLNLVKSTKVKHREYIIHKEFEKAIDSVKEDLADEADEVEFKSLDLDAAFKKKEDNELEKVKEKAEEAVNKTGIFSCQIPQSINFEASPDMSYIWKNSIESNNSCKQQKGVLRSNCLDSLDRTNFSQYVYGVVVLGHQLRTLGITESQVLSFQDPLANDLMDHYQAMGDALSQQYGGSPAHHKIFAKIRGQHKVASQFQEFMKSIQRHCSNSFTDGSKQQAIDIFLGQNQPEAAEGDEVTTLKTEQDQTQKYQWLKFFYLLQLFRCNLCINSGFERLWSDGSGSYPGRLTGPSGSPEYEPQEGQRMVDFTASR